MSGTPKTGLPHTGQMRTEWRYIFETFIFVSPLTFLFLFYNPETAVHQPPAAAPQCPREQLRREVISQSDELQRGWQAGTEDRARLFKSPRRGRKPCWRRPSLPPEGSVCLCCSHESSASPERPPLLSGIRVCQRFLTLKTETKQVPPPPCHPVYMRDKITFVQK